MITTSRNSVLTIAVFAISSLLITISVYIGIPVFMKAGLRFGEAYLFCFYWPFVLLFAGALILYCLEGHPWTWKAFAERLRLQRMDGRTVLWTVGFFILLAAGYFVVTVVGKYLAAHIPILAPPDFMPGGLNPNKVMQPGYFFDIPLKGNLWFAAGYAAGWFFNIFGEELMFRGFLLPLDQRIYGRMTWLIHGVLWGLWHVYWKWSFLPLLVFFTVPMVYIVYRQKNTWVGIIIHGIMNAIPLGYILVNVFG